jgi:mono/diheme cytochrome c family protein
MKEPVLEGRGVTDRASRAATRWLSIIIAGLVLPHCTKAADTPREGFDAYLRGDYESAFEILLPAATTANPEIQNLVGLMFYEGQGTAANSVAAHGFFHDAAEAGVTDAGRNLGVLHSIGAPGVEIDYEEARMWFTSAAANDYPVDTAALAGSISIPDTIDTRIEVEFKYDGDGKDTYLTFCAGCHGFSGMRSFPFAPSFAMADRMTKNSRELMQSILRGKGLMPSWEDKLPRSSLENALGYLRELALRTGYGTDTSAYDVSPDMYFIFSPYGTDDQFLRELNLDPVESD